MAFSEMTKQTPYVTTFKNIICFLTEIFDAQLCMVDIELKHTKINFCHVFVFLTFAPARRKCNDTTNRRQNTTCKMCRVLSCICCVVPWCFVFSPRQAKRRKRDKMPLVVLSCFARGPARRTLGTTCSHLYRK